MRMDIDEIVVRVARFPESLRSVPILSGDPAEPIDCEWLAISRVAAEPSVGPETFILYFIDGRGIPHGYLQYETLEIALDQAADISGFPPHGWTSCALIVTREYFEIEELESVVAAAG